MKKKSSSDTDNKTIIIDMPEVKDIPGQEHIKPPVFKEMLDSTISSSGEEGEGILDDLNTDNEPDLDGDLNVSDTERNLMKQSDRPVTDEAKDLKGLKLDDTDGDDDLNEDSNPLNLGEDLDVPGSENDDENEAIGEEDEENNSYSRPD